MGESTNATPERDLAERMHRLSEALGGRESCIFFGRERLSEMLDAAAGEIVRLRADAGPASPPADEDYFVACLGGRSYQPIAGIGLHRGTNAVHVAEVMTEARETCPRAADTIAMFVWSACHHRQWAEAMLAQMGQDADEIERLKAEAERLRMAVWDTATMEPGCISEHADGLLGDEPSMRTMIRRKTLELVAEDNGRLRRAIEDAAGKAELGAKMVESADVADGFLVIAKHCRDALSALPGPEREVRAEVADAADGRARDAAD